MVESVYMHLRSVALLRRDKGWIHHFLEESDNERFHFITFVKMKKPGPLMRIHIMLQQILFAPFFFFCYLISPRYCHKFVGYLEEQGFKAYTDMIKEIDREKGVLSHWK
jgi:hypothetical protein